MAVKSEKIKAVYDYVKRRIDEGFSPTVREICADLGIKSTSTAHRYVDQLVRDGLLEKSGNLNRSIRLVGQGGTHVPLVGTVTAGQPITAIQDITDYIAFQTDRSYEGNLFALNIRGSSMIEAGIFDGDIVIVEQTSAAQNGEIVIAMVDGEDATCKRFFKENGHYRLQPENSAMDPIIVDKVEILGKVVAMLRYF